MTFCRRNLLLATALVAIVGCEPTADSARDDRPVAAGPKGGQLLRLEPAGVEAELTHEENFQLVSVYFDKLDADNISKVKLIVKAGKSGPEEFELERSLDSWTVTSESLNTYFDLWECTQMRLVVVRDGVELAAPVVHPSRAR